MEGFCRACLNKFNESTDLLQYCESNRRLFVYCTGLQVKHNDSFTFQLCKECYLNLKFACKFKKQCRTSDKKIKSYLALKKDGESVDFITYLKSIEDTLTFRLPITSKNNTPAHQKNYDDDDNLSTCTSIQNFMSDMLQGEEMLPAEARIIREVIQEEADILEDSLDSHWLQDDISVDNDFGMDFNFAGFSTPHSIDNNHCYTPRRLTNYYTPKEILPKSKHNQVAQGENNTSVKNISNHNYKENIVVNQNDMPLLDGCDIELNGMVKDGLAMGSPKTENYECNENNNKQITVVLNKGIASQAMNSPLKKEFESYMNILETNKISSINTINDGHNIQNNIETVLIENEIDVLIEQSLPDQFINSDKFNQEKYTQSLESTVKCEIDQYINKVELKKKVNTGLNDSKHFSKKCSIDRNLEMALNNNDSQEFALDQLLISPQVSIRSGASTPTINNILFGHLTPVVPDVGLSTVEEPNTTGFKEEFLGKNQRQNTPRKGSKQTKLKKNVKDLSKLKESESKPNKGIGKGQKGLKRSEYKTLHSRRGYKDMKRLKDRYNCESICETLDNDISDSEQSVSVENITNESKKEDDNEIVNDKRKKDNYSGTVKIEIEKENCSEMVKSEIKIEHFNETDMNEINENYNRPIKSEILEEIHPSADDNIKQSVDDDYLDISFSKLLHFDDSQNVDLNMSIASDFLNEEKHDDGSNIKDREFVFKAPLSPPDNKYDLDQNLCKICDKTYKNNSVLRRHFVNVHKQRLPLKEKKKRAPQKLIKVCPKCGIIFHNSSQFWKHMKKHEDPHDFKCKFCTLEFPTRGRFNLHMRIHVKELNKEKTLENNDQNIAIKDNTEKCKTDKPLKRYICTKCAKEFTCIGNYNIHMRRHNKIYSVKCDVCEKGFFRNYELKIHMATHNQEHQFACKYCPQTYRSRHFLIGHMYKHLGKDTFKCEFCDKQFISNQHLQQHYKTKKCQEKRMGKVLEGHDSVVTISYKKIKYQDQAKGSSTKGMKENVTEVDTVETSKTKVC